MKCDRKNITAAAAAALLAGGLLLTVYAALGIWPFGDISVITGDLNAQYIPVFAHFRRSLAAAGQFAASFEKSLGGDLLGMFAYYCTSPFNLIYLLFPISGYAAAAGLVLGAKLMAASGFFALFTGCHDARTPLWARVALGVGYAFCGYNIAYSQNCMWLDVVALLPLLCLGLDQLVRDGQPLFYGVTLAVTIFSNFYIAYMACIFCVLYFGWLLLCERPRAMKQAVSLFFAASLAGGLLNTWLLLPALSSISDSKGGLFSFDFSWAQQFFLPALFARLLPGNFSVDEMPAGLPLLYCGLLSLPLVFAYFFSRSIGRREKICSAAILTLLAVSFVVRGLDTIWHGLKAPVWFGYRYSFLFSFWLLFLAAGAAARVQWTKRLAAAAGLGCAAVFALAYFLRAPTFSRRIWLAGFVVAAVLWALLAIVPKRRAAAGLLAAVCLCELGLNAVFVLRQFEPYSVSAYEAFVEQGTQAVEMMQQDAGGAPFRAEMTGFRTLNDPLLLGYWGISHFTSTQDSGSTDALVRLGYGNYGACNTYLYGSTPVADALLGIRYIVRPENGKPVQPVYPALFTAGEQEIFENPFALPLAVTAQSDIIELPLENGEDPFLWQQRVLGLLAHTAEPPQVFVPLDEASRQDSEAILTAKADGAVYLFLKTAQPAALTVNGRAWGTIGDPENQGMICLGVCAAGETLHIQADALITVLYAYTLDAQQLQAACDAAGSHGAAIHTMADGRISLTVQANEEDVLWVATPYAGQWKATVNGAPAQTFPVAGTFSGVALQPGQNEVLLKWRVPHLELGIIISCAGAALLVKLAADVRRRRQKKAS